MTTIAIKILATGNVQRIEHTTPMCQIHYSQIGNGRSFKARGKAPAKLTGSATFTASHVTVDGSEMRRTASVGTLGFQDGDVLWVVSKIQNANGSFVAFAAKVLDDRNL